MFGWWGFGRRRTMCSYENLRRRRRSRAPFFVLPLIGACMLLVIVCFIPVWAIALVLLVCLALAALWWR